MTSGKKNLIKKVWKFIWESDSPWSWLVNIVLAFIIVKFIIYPGLGLILGTNYPVVAVVSGSMTHNLEQGTICGYRPMNYESNFDGYWDVCGAWYENKGITKEEAENWRFKDGFNKGDIMILTNANPEKIDIGDVVVFKSYLPDPIIHRVVTKKPLNNSVVFQTKGDHNNDMILQHKEDNVTQDRVVGKALMRIPYLGWVKIIAVDAANFIVKLFRGM